MNPAQKAFTLIELLIVISLITIITGATIPSFNNYLNNQSIKQSLEQVKDDLRTTQNRALNGENSTSQVNSLPPVYWFVQFISGSNIYKFYYSNTMTDVCNNSSDNREEFSTSAKLPGDNVIRSEDSCIFFSFSNGDATYSPGGADEIIVGPPYPGTPCKRLRVESNGFIHEIIDDISCS